MGQKLADPPQMSDSSANQQVVQRAREVLIGNYARLPISMERGQGSLLWDADGKQYIDLFAGFGGTILGHCHPELIAAVHEQAQKLWAVGNTFFSQPQIDFAERIGRHAFAGQAFFCHSGAEANEAACKLARLRGQQDGGKRWKIISLNKSFHGRTLAMIAATGNPNYRVGFGPVVPGFAQVDSGDFDALANAVDAETAAILLEPIQGEGGVNVYPPGYPQKVRELCDRHGLTLIVDEVWTGGGRTGRWFAYQYFDGVEPDIMTLGKAVGGGLPVGVMYAKPALAKLLVPGTHGCTLGGNPICMAAAAKVFDVIERQKLVEHAAALGELAVGRLRKESKIQSKIKEIRGHGLMLGIQLADPPQKFVENALQQGLVINLTSKDVIRLAPAINIDRQLWSAGLDKLVELIATL
jgi:predicted acetylornithine/succinylornithine family transaminase